MLAVVEDSLASDVDAGENAGLTLRHAGVVRALVEAGDVPAGQTSFSVSASVPFADGWDRANLRAVAFVQEAGTRAVTAIGAAPLIP